MDDSAATDAGAVHAESMKRRAARFGWITAGLVGLALVLVGTAAWLLATTDGPADSPRSAMPEPTTVPSSRASSSNRSGDSRARSSSTVSQRS